MCKLEYIFNCLTDDITKLLDIFWADHKIPSKKLNIDTDNLHSLIVYIISRMKTFPNLIANL